jgi:hypothetical protein
MDNEALRHLWALRKMNKALMQGIKLVIASLEQAEEISKETRQSMITILKGLIAQSEEVYRETAIKR